MNNEVCLSGFTEIPADELQGMNGGALPFIAAFAVIVIEQVIADWDNFKNGLLGNPEEKDH